VPSSVRGEFCDRLMVPIFFEPYAHRLAELLKGATSGQVLQIEAGTGCRPSSFRSVCPIAL
jgi:hypothetical protein